MHDARHVEDKRLLEAGDHKLLLAGYFHAARDLLLLRLGDREAADEAVRRCKRAGTARTARARTAGPSIRRVSPWREARDGQHAARTREERECWDDSL